MTTPSTPPISAISLAIILALWVIDQNTISEMTTPMMTNNILDLFKSRVFKSKMGVMLQFYSFLIVPKTLFSYYSFMDLIFSHALIFASPQPHLSYLCSDPLIPYHMFLSLSLCSYPYLGPLISTADNSFTSHLYLLDKAFSYLYKP